MKPVNENATKEAKELLAYLYETAGKKIITGQHTQTNPMEEITYIHEKTGAYPKLQGFELLSYSKHQLCGCIRGVPDRGKGKSGHHGHCHQMGKGDRRYCFYLFSLVLTGGRKR